MSFGPTDRCSFCGGVYYIQKLGAHESICSLRPKRLTVGRAVRLAIESHPEALGNSALLVRLVWQSIDGYRTEPPRTRLTDPRLIAKALVLLRRAGRLSPRPPKVMGRRTKKTDVR